MLLRATQALSWSMLQRAGEEGSPSRRVYCIVEKRIPPKREASQKQTVTQRRRPRSVKEEAHPLNAAAAPAEQEPPPQAPARAVFGKTRATTRDLGFYERRGRNRNLTPPRRYYRAVACQ